MSTAELPSTPAGGRPLVGVTAERLLNDFADQRCELIEGEVILMSPANSQHGVLAHDLALLIGAHVKQHNIGRCFAAETGFCIARNPDTVIAPDCSVVLADRIKAIGVPTAYFPEAPALAVEVVSPRDTAEEVDSKARRWLAAGTRMVWVVYPKGRQVTVYRSLDDIRVLTEDAVLDGAEVIPGFTAKVSEIFAGLDAS